MLTISRNAPCPCGSGSKYKHCCMHKESEIRQSVGQIQQRTMDQAQLNIKAEADYIIGRARDGDARLVSLNSLIIFSTETRDAWIIDPKDHLALCLMQDGEKQSFRITETSSNFSIEWDSNYHMDSDIFTITKKSGRVVAKFGYPVREILQLIHRSNLTG